MRNVNLNLPDKKLIITLFLIGLFSVIAFILVVVSYLGGNDSSPSTTSNDLPTPSIASSTKSSGLESDYSRINSIVPGKTSFNELQKINGQPESIKRTPSKTYVYYKTPSEYYKNVIVTQNNKVLYATEKVFGNYRQNVSEYRSAYGRPNLVMYDAEEGYPWDIYPTRGLGFQNDGKDVGNIVYFVPQSRESFVTNLAPNLNMQLSASGSAN